MDELLSAWRAAGSHFDFRGHAVFLRRGGAGTAVLAIHGYPLSSIDFAEVWPALTRQHEVLAPDMLGCGFSDKPRGVHYDFDLLTDLHVELLAHFRVSRVHVLAFDLGTAIAQE